MERVLVREGKYPVIIVAPHGEPTDDAHTDKVAEVIAEEMDCYMVVNKGWKRGKRHDYGLEIANCNNMSHLHEEVVKEEFLDPILQFKSRILKKHNRGFMFTVHGVGDYVRKEADDPGLGIILGTGRGLPPSFTCKSWMRDYLIFLLRQADVTACIGAPGGRYSGWSSNNLNQIFRKHYAESSMYSMQLEIVKSLRYNRIEARITGMLLAVILEDLTQRNDWNPPRDFSIYEI